MIFTPHIIVGALIGAKTQNLGLIVILGLLTHLIMDRIPHWDYSVVVHAKEFRRTKSVKFLFPLILKSSIDVFLGFLIIFIIVWQKNLFHYLFFIVFGMFFAVLPDIFAAFTLIFGTDKFLNKFTVFLYRFLHVKDKEKEGEITFLNVSTEILVIIIGIIIFFS